MDEEKKSTVAPETETVPAGAPADDEGFSGEKILKDLNETAKVEDLEKMEEKDEEGVKKRTFTDPVLRNVFRILCIGLTCFALFNHYIKLLNTYTYYTTFWAIGMVLVYMSYPMSKKSKSKHKPQWFDYIFIAAAVAVPIWVQVEGVNVIMDRLQGIKPCTQQELIFGIIVTVVSWEAARRCVGWGLPTVALVFLLYARFGNYIPGLFHNKGYSWNRIFDHLLSLQGVFGNSTKMCAEYIYLLLIFGAFLHISGAGEYFIRLALAMTGASRGGPAKVAVVASALFGTVSGSAVSNVVGTGSFTIPLMKKTGYRAEFAGAVEAVSSTGGQLMPPIMGSAAFLMVELVEVPYATIAISAILPALLYYFSLFIAVDLEAQRSELKGIPKDQLEKTSYVLKSGFQLLLPLFALIITFGILRWSVKRAAGWGIIACLVCSWLTPGKAMGPKKIIDALELSAVRANTIIACLGCTGITVGCILLTGVANKFTTLLISLAGSSTLLAFVIAALVAIVLGMGLPTIAAYMIVCSVLSSGLIKMGFAALPVNMFLFYFSIISQITPPVALAAYTAAGIANANFSKVGFTAMRLGWVALVVPFIFIYNNSLLLIGEWYVVLIAFITAVAGCYLMSLAFYGWFMTKKMNFFQRIVALGAGLCMLIPGTMTDFIGIGGAIVFALIFPPLREKIFKKKALA